MSRDVGELQRLIAELRDTASPGHPEHPDGTDADDHAHDHVAAHLAARLCAVPARDALVGTVDPATYARTAATWRADLDHRCEHPDRVAAALLDQLTAIAEGVHGRSPAAPGEAHQHLLLDEVRAHPTEPSADAAVLSDALLHILADDVAPPPLLSLGELSVRALPTAEALQTADSIFYTPEARSRLEAIAQLNLARARRATTDTTASTDTQPALLTPGGTR